MNPKGENVKLFLVVFQRSRKDKIIYEKRIFQAQEGKQDEAARKILKSCKSLNGAKIILVINFEAAMTIVSALVMFCTSKKNGILQI